MVPGHYYRLRPTKWSVNMAISSVKPLPSELDIQRGLALGEFRAWYQPKLNMRTGQLVGAEALVRWEHPARCVLLPDSFLAAVLAYDLIDDMFRLLLEQGLNLLCLLRRQSMQLELAFNLHASQLLDDTLVTHIQLALGRYGFSGSSLVFEVAENGLLNASLTVQKNLLRLRMLGCVLSIDDFGDGFSSLKLLCQLPFNQLKLDGKFVRHAPSMISSTLALAKSLDMDLVIEGVGSSRIRDGALALGCELGQGYYLARPMAARRLLPWLEARV